MLSERKGRNKYQNCDNLRQILVPLWNIFTFIVLYQQNSSPSQLNGRENKFIGLSIWYRKRTAPVKMSLPVSSGLVFVVGKNTKQTKQISRA